MKRLMSAWWAQRGDAVGAIARAEGALLACMSMPIDKTIDDRVRAALGCLRGAEELIVLATERLHQLAEEKSEPKQPTPGEGTQ